MTDPNEETLPANVPTLQRGSPEELAALRAADPEFDRMMSDDVKLTMGAATDKAIAASGLPRTVETHAQAAEINQHRTAEDGYVKVGDTI